MSTKGTQRDKSIAKKDKKEQRCVHDGAAFLKEGAQLILCRLVLQARHKHRERLATICTSAVSTQRHMQQQKTQPAREPSSSFATGLASAASSMSISCASLAAAADASAARRSFFLRFLRAFNERPSALSSATGCSTEVVSLSDAAASSSSISARFPIVASWKTMTDERG